MMELIGSPTGILALARELERATLRDTVRAAIDAQRERLSKARDVRLANMNAPIEAWRELDETVSKEYQRLKGMDMLVDAIEEFLG